MRERAVDVVHGRAQSRAATQSLGALDSGRARRRKLLPAPVSGSAASTRRPGCAPGAEPAASRARRARRRVSSAAARSARASSRRRQRARRDRARRRREPLGQPRPVAASARSSRRPASTASPGFSRMRWSATCRHRSTRIDSPMRSFRYVLADVFTDRPLAGNQLAVFTDARDLDEVTMQELALELGFSETRLRAAAARRRHRADPDLHAAQRDSVRRAPVSRHRVRARRAAAARRDRARDRLRDRPGRARAGRVRADRLRQDDAAGADGRAVRPRGRDARGARRRVVGAAGRGLRQRRPARIRRAPVERGRRRAEAGHGRARRARPRRRARVRGLGYELEDADVLAARTASGRTPRPGRPPARSPATSAATGSCRGASRSRSSRARRSAGPRRSMRGRPAPGTRSSRSRSAARP